MTTFVTRIQSATLIDSKVEYTSHRAGPNVHQSVTFLDEPGAFEVGEVVTVTIDHGQHYPAWSVDTEALAALDTAKVAPLHQCESRMPHDPHGLCQGRTHPAQ